MPDDGFFSRWSRRKSQGGRDEPPEAGPPAPAEPPVEPAAASPASGQSQAEPPSPPPTLEDVARLTPESDYSRFVAKDVDEGVKRAAMKKLFSDPHFNKMDGLDVYIDDYSQSTPIPQAVLRQMVQSQFLGLFREEAATAQDHDQPDTGARPDGGQDAGVPASYAEKDIGAAHEGTPAGPRDADEDPDLQLQPNDAARRPGPGEGTGH